jgi:nicotinamide-nucleotide adenylyltransferase
MSDDVQIEQAIYDLPRLFAFREVIESLDLAAPPTVRVLYPRAVASLRRVGILCGSFNPLTLAHTELAERARQVFQLDCVFFTLAKVTVDKERVTGMGLEDRLLVLSCYAQRRNGVGVALVNRGLYFEQAKAFRLLLGSHVELSFVIGMDKLFQIFDPRYYQDRDGALQQLFASASLLIANRGDMDRHAFTQLLERPANRPYRTALHFFLLPASVTGLSATAVRAAVATGKSVENQVPAETAAFLNETRAYSLPVHSGDESLDAYAVRMHLLKMLYPVRPWAARQVNFRQLMRMALSPDENGKMLRHISDGKELLQLLRSRQKGS